MPEVFSVLKRVGEASGAGGTPSWLATHPDPANRREAIEARIASLGHDFSGAKIGREGYFQRLDGMVFGEDPRAGFFEETMFYHPDLAFQLDFPAGWKTRNQRQSVVAISEQQDAIFELTLQSEEDPEAAVREFLEQEGLRGGGVESGRIHGQRAATGLFEATVQETEIAGRVVFIRYQENTYRLLGYSRRDAWNGYSGAVDRTQKSFRRLRDKKILAMQPARLERVRPSRELSIDEFPGAVPVERTARDGRPDQSRSICRAGRSPPGSTRSGSSADASASRRAGLKKRPGDGPARAGRPPAEARRACRPGRHGSQETGRRRPVSSLSSFSSFSRPSTDFVSCNCVRAAHAMYSSS